MNLETSTLRRVLALTAILTLVLAASMLAGCRKGAHHQAEYQDLVWNEHNVYWYEQHPAPVNHNMHQGNRNPEWPYN